jgi:hypothetical protein
MNATIGHYKETRCTPWLDIVVLFSYDIADFRERLSGQETVQTSAYVTGANIG